MTDRQARRLPLVLAAAIPLLCLALQSDAQTPATEDVLGGAEASPVPPFPASPPPGAPTPSPRPQKAKSAGPGNQLPESAAAVPTPAPRLIPPEAYDEPLTRDPPDVVTPKPEPRPGNAEAAGPSPAAVREPAAGGAICQARLGKLGVAFEERPPVSGPAGCAIAQPVAVTAVSEDVALEPEALMNCPMAEAVARFTRDVVAPAAEEIFGSELVSIQQASAYVCRPRNGTETLSEHAFGNALDFGAFTLADGRVITVESTADPKEQQFLTRLRRAACGPFTTVLGPGSDADHATHFHFDLQPRRAGSTWCE